MKKLPRFGRIIDKREKSVPSKLSNGMKRFITVLEVHCEGDGSTWRTKHLAMFVEGRGYLPIYLLLEAGK